MHQISMLGSPLRPDRVYRTSVLSPMTGYRPGEAVQQVATNFTQGPYRGMSLSGLGAAAPVGTRIKAWWEGVKARVRGGMPALPPTASIVAQSTVPSASEPQFHPPGASMPPTSQGYAHGYHMAPAAAQAGMLYPAMRGMPQHMVAQAYGQSSSLPPFAGEAATKATMMMWRGLRWPWH